MNTTLKLWSTRSFLICLLGFTASCAADGALPTSDAGVDQTEDKLDQGTKRDVSKEDTDNADVTTKKMDGGGSTDMSKDVTIDTNPDPDTSGTLQAFDNLVPEGFPNSQNTGVTVPIDQLTRHEGNFNSTSDNEVIENLLITGYLNLKHKNVTVRNCRVLGGEFFGIVIREPGALIEDTEIGLEGKYATLTKAVAPNDNTIQVDTNINVGSYLLLSSHGESLRTFRVQTTRGDGPFTLELERHYHEATNGQEVIKVGTPDIKFGHPIGATVSYYDPSTSNPLPQDGILSMQVQDKIIRRTNIHHVNDGFKMDNGLFEGNYVHEQIYIPKSHLDSVQATRGVGAILRHNSLVASREANGIQLAPDQGELKDLTMEYNYVSGGGIILRWGVDGGKLRHNRFGRDFQFSAMTIYTGGSIDEVKDNRFADDGEVVKNAADTAFGDKDGDGSGNGSAWGAGYENQYALPGN